MFTNSSNSRILCGYTTENNNKNGDSVNTKKQKNKFDEFKNTKITVFTNEQIAKVIARDLKELRSKLGYTIYRLGKETGIQPSTIKYYENGKRIPLLIAFYKYCYVANQADIDWPSKEWK